MDEKDETCKIETTARSAIAVEQGFENNVLHGMDVFETNMFLLLEKRYGGLEPQTASKRALAEIETFAKMAGKMPITWEGKTASLLFYLKELAGKGAIAKLALTNDGQIVVYGGKGEEFLKFSLAGVLSGAVKADAMQKRVSCMEGYRAEAGREMAGRFAPLEMPSLNYSFVRRNAPPMSRFLGMKKTTDCVDVIEPEFRHKKLCSTYAYMVMEDLYGKEAVERMCLNKSKTPSALEVKAFFGKNLTATVSMKDQFQKISGPDGKPRLKIKNEDAYNAKLGEIASAVDGGKVPGYMTIYIPMSANFHDIWGPVVAHNAKTPEAFQSWNSHVIVILGRGEKKAAKVKDADNMSMDLYSFMAEKSEIKPQFFGLINLEIHRADGRVLKIAPNGVDVIEKVPGGQSNGRVIKVSQVNLEQGDTVYWQDILFTHYVAGTGHVGELAAILSSHDWFPYEYLTFDSLSVQKHPDYSPTGFLQLKAGVPVKKQVLASTKMSEADFEYYLAALEDLGIDINRVREIDILPTFDMKAVRATIAKKGGISAMRSAALRENLGQELAKYPGAKFIVIEGGKTPWDHIRGLFEPQFTGKNVLSRGERNLILDAVDQSCGNVSFMPPVNFPAGEMIYLTEGRIKEIVAYVRGVQSKAFGPDDYVQIMEKGTSLTGFVQKSFDSQVVKADLEAAKIDVKFGKLDGFEKDYVMKIFADGKDLRKLAEGERLVLKRAKLDEAIGLIAEKRLLQRPNEEFGGVFVSYPSGVQLVEETWPIPEDVLQLINEAYTGDSVEDVIIRNSLYFIYAREQMGGGFRGAKKDFALDYLPERKWGLWGDYLVKSVGLFQTRSTDQDLKLVKGKFAQFGLALPRSAEDLREMLKDNKLASTLVAGERIRENFRIFMNLMKANGESGMDYFDETFAVMLTTSFNRSPEAVTRAVFQNWAYNLAQAAGVSSDVGLDDIDKSPAAVEKEVEKEEEQRRRRFSAVNGYSVRGGMPRPMPSTGSKISGDEKLNMDIVHTFERVVEKLINEGKIQFKGDYRAIVRLILVSKERFLKSSLWFKIKEWYAKNVDKRGLRFTFKGSEIDRGNGVFSYGKKYLWSYSIDEDRKPAFGGSRRSMHGMCWGRAFKDRERLREIMVQMRGR
ncbi:hypothetical protein HY604_01340 [Candidatus Peregrinibacteria bacterium]|nr:hypothetical protein [Candidatus Peregrinibacteria bacterium]